MLVFPEYSIMKTFEITTHEFYDEFCDKLKYWVTAK